MTDKITYKTNRYTDLTPEQRAFIHELGLRVGDEEMPIQHANSSQDLDLTPVSVNNPDYLSDKRSVKYQETKKRLIAKKAWRIEMIKHRLETNPSDVPEFLKRQYIG